MKKPIFLFIITMLVSGCASSTYWGIDRTRSNLMKIEISMTKQEVLNIMGTPYRREAYSTPDGKVLDFLLYLTQAPGYQISDNDITPVCLVNDKVTGWGRNFYEQQKQRYEIEIKQSSRQ